MQEISSCRAVRDVTDSTDLRFCGSKRRCQADVAARAADLEKHGRALYRRRRCRQGLLHAGVGLLRYSMIDLRRAATHEAGHCVSALHFTLRLCRVWIHGDGRGATEYSRQFVGTGEVEAWTIATFSGIEAEIDRFGDAPQGGDLRVLEEMVRRLGLTWSRSNLDRFRQRARVLVVQECRAITVLADALCDRRHMTSDEIGALLSAVTTPRALWVVA